MFWTETGKACRLLINRCRLNRPSYLSQFGTFFPGTPRKPLRGMWCPSLTSTCCFLISPPLKSVLLNKPLLSVDQLEAPPCLLFLASFKVLTNGRWLDAEGRADEKRASDERRAWTCSNSQKRSRIKRNSSGQRKQNKAVWKSSPTTSTHSITFTLGKVNDKGFSFTAC